MFSEILTHISNLRTDNLCRALHVPGSVHRLQDKEGLMKQEEPSVYVTGPHAYVEGNFNLCKVCRLSEKAPVHSEDPIVVHPSGAKSSHHDRRYDLLPRAATDRRTKRYEEGAAKFGEGNWEGGLHDRAFILDRWNHARTHLDNWLEKFKNGTLGQGDDDAAALAWAADFFMMVEENRRDSYADQLRYQMASQASNLQNIGEMLSQNPNKGTL